MLKNEQLREIYYNNLNVIIRDLILSHIEALAELDRAKFEISQFEHPHTDSRHSWTPAQWLEAKRKEILGE